MARKGRGSFGSPRHTEERHGGKVAGAGMVRTGEPGSFARGVKAVHGEAIKPAAAGGPARRGMRGRDMDGDAY